MQPIESIDLAAWNFFHTHQPAWLNPVMVAITNLGSFAVLFPLVCVMVAALVWLRGPRTALVYAAAALLAFVLCAGTQLAVGRPRPDPPFPVVPIPTAPSFPSGHTMNSLVDYGLFALLATRGLPLGPRTWWRLLGFVVPFLIGFTRLYLAVHYVSDVLAGWLGGVGIVLVALAIDRPPPEPAPAPGSTSGFPA